MTTTIGRHRADIHDNPAFDTFVFHAPTLAEGLAQYPRVERPHERVPGGMVLRLGDIDINPASCYTLFSDIDFTTPAARPVAMSGTVLTPATAATAGDVVGIDTEGRLLSRTVDPRGVWRKTLVGNFPSGRRKAKARLAELPRRYELVFRFANRLEVDSFGGCELGSAFWRVLEDRGGWGGQRGLANSVAGSNRVGNGNLWRHAIYRCLDRAHFTITGLPSGEFNYLDMPVVLLEDKMSGAIHAEVTIHNFARRYSTPGERIKVINYLIRLVNRLTDAGIPVILRGDFNSSHVWQRLEEETELVKAAPHPDLSIDMILVTEGIDTRRPAEVTKADRPRLAALTDHTSVTTVEHRIPVDVDCPRDLPRFPRITT